MQSPLLAEPSGQLLEGILGIPDAVLPSPSLAALSASDVQLRARILSPKLQQCRAMRERHRATEWVFLFAEIHGRGSNELHLEPPQTFRPQY